MNITFVERRLIMRALDARATRLEAIALRLKHGRKHDVEAAAMRRLRVRLFELQPAALQLTPGDDHEEAGPKD